MLHKIGIATVALLLTGASAMAQQPSNRLDPSRTAPGSSDRSTTNTVDAPASRGAGTGENKPSATGGQPGGGTEQQ